MFHYIARVRKWKGINYKKYLFFETLKRKLAAGDVERLPNRQ